ncbi:unnamed protein product [Adineta steineri]|uniref:Transmembrane protein n=1 Tax=Adineta steineri TaxID=433720 RepID=A0A815L9W5_9BILA|nr:unnamed protein product [Adineta steineri]CAF1614048.1 unnamed protein product [Adineta steineri]
MPYSSAVQSNYSSELTKNSQTYSRDCRKSNYYYQTIRMQVVETGYFALSSTSSMDTFGDIYKDDFNPMNPFENLLSQDYQTCVYPDFKFIAYLHIDTTYILVVTTSSPNKTGNFSILTSGPNNITLNHYTQILTSCFIGQTCQFYKKSIGVTLDDILRGEIRPNMTITDQTIMLKTNIALTMIMFVGGLINSILSLITFQNKDLRQVGSGIYLLASSITSFFTISINNQRHTKGQSKLNVSTQNDKELSVSTISILFDALPPSYNIAVDNHLPQVLLPSYDIAITHLQSVDIQSQLTTTTAATEDLILRV